jgi:putative hydrolase of the HAD superfamily
MLKPDPRIFGMLLDEAGVAADRAVHVGDDPEADVEGARRAGVEAVWLNRTSARWPDALPAPRHSISTLAELAPLLAAPAD